MLPNDPQLAFDQAMATMAERQHQSAQERLARKGQLATTAADAQWHGGAHGVLRSLVSRLGPVLRGRRHPRQPTADKEPGTAIS
jgi:protein involved in temperature-dependent protein secretion